MAGSSNTIKSPNDGGRSGKMENHQQSGPLPDLNREVSGLILEHRAHKGLSAGFFNQPLPPQANSLIRAPVSFSDQTSGGFNLHSGQNATRALKYLVVIIPLRLKLNISHSSLTGNQSGSNNQLKWEPSPLCSDHTGSIDIGTHQGTVRA